jgi:hypothetical protein
VCLEEKKTWTASGFDIVSLLEIHKVCPMLSATNFKIAHYVEQLFEQTYIVES